MPDLLLELFSEEIPARLQTRASQDLARMMVDGLVHSGLTVGSAEDFAGPRRLTLIAKGIPSQSAGTSEERKGPRVGAPDKAVEGFLRAAGLRDINEAQIVKDAKGDFYAARIEKPGRPAEAIIAGVVSETVRKFPWPKSMRWGSGRLKWIRPLHSILCLFNDKPVVFEIDGIVSGNTTVGHRFLSGKKITQPEDVKIEKISDYSAVLMRAKVVVAGENRAKRILEGAYEAAAGAGLALVEDHGLLQENAGLVEWPVVLSGTFDESFLSVPEEILTTAMKTHQKYFSLRHKTGGELANRFIIVSNIEAEDGGQAIVAGNERVIRARLSDAQFFWRNDKARPLDDLVALLGQVTFHEKLGTQLQRVQRIERLAREIAGITNADTALAQRAAHVAKADLMSETVGEFPELQGLIGRYIALAQGECAAVADAVADHYKPQGPSDKVPSQPVAIAVALADKLDMLVGFWVIAEKPTGSKDPFALRRAALGIIRIVLESELRIGLRALLAAHATLVKQITTTAHSALRQDDASFADEVSASLVDFIADRLKVYLRDRGIRHDLIDAVFALPNQDDLLIAVRRTEALARFFATEDAPGFLALIRRALNILKIEEKKDARLFQGSIVPKLLRAKEEKALNTAIKGVRKEVQASLAAEDFEAAMAQLAKLRAPVDAFFEEVTVNAEEMDVRANRLNLLAQIRALASGIADFARIEG